LISFISSLNGARASQLLIFYAAVFAGILVGNLGGMVAGVVAGVILGLFTSGHTVPYANSFSTISVFGGGIVAGGLAGILGDIFSKGPNTMYLVVFLIVVEAVSFGIAKFIIFVNERFYENSGW